MTEPEAVEAAQAIYANAITMFTVYFTIVSSYVIVAYLVGRSLTRFQAGFATTIFLVTGGVTLAALAALLEVGLHYTAIAMQLRDSADKFAGTVASGSFISFVVAVDAVFLLGGLKFMWDIRHPKSE